MHPRVAWRLFTSLAHHPSPVAIRYFSVVPYLLGSVAAKYSLTPVEPVSTDMPHAPSADYLREKLKARLAERSVRFDFAVQLRSDPTRMPIEDPSVRWNERDAPFRKVATLEIPIKTSTRPNGSTSGNPLLQSLALLCASTGRSVASAARAVRCIARSRHIGTTAMRSRTASRTRGDH